MLLLITEDDESWDAINDSNPKTHHVRGIVA